MTYVMNKEVTRLKQEYITNYNSFIGSFSILTKGMQFGKM